MSSGLADPSPRAVVARLKLALVSGSRPRVSRSWLLLEDLGDGGRIALATNPAHQLGRDPWHQDNPSTRTKP